MSYKKAAPLKLLESSSGEGVLHMPSGVELVMGYQLDTYLERGRKIVSGSLEGDASRVEDGAVGRLQLVSGEQVEIALIKPDDRGADFRSLP
ncbi:MAG: hypothetical protein WA840_09060 [Caulobacteraceae bacterium]